MEGSQLTKSPQALFAVVCIVAVTLTGGTAQAAPSTTSTSATSDWPPFKFSRFEYIFVPRAESWPTAQDTCESKYNASLASIHSQEEQDFILKTFIETQDPTKFPVRVPASIYPATEGISHRGVWIGLRTDIEVGGLWSDNSTLDFFNWIDGKPDNYKAQEGCTEIYVDRDMPGWYGMWDDLSCVAELPFICKRDVGLNKTNPPVRYGGFDYILHYERLPVVEAEKTCQEVDDAHLTSIATQAELAFLVQTFFQGQPTGDFEAKMPGGLYPEGYNLGGVYVGLVKLNASKWAWVDSNSSEFRPWGPGVPDGFANVTENCAALLWTDRFDSSFDGKLNDVNCRVAMPFICKRKATGNAAAGSDSNSTTPSSVVDTTNPQPTGLPNNGTAASEQQPCPDGQFAKDGSVCTPCPAGSFSVGGSNCQPCKAGFYSAADGATACTPCPAGTYCPAPGVSTPTPCPDGMFSTKQGLVSGEQCERCPAGTYATAPVHNTTGSTSCSDCPPGTYTDSVGNAKCWQCPAGTYSNATRATSSSTCQSCPAGTYSPALGASSSSACQLCPVGTYSPPELVGTGQPCLKCPAGAEATGVAGAISAEVACTKG